MKRLSVAARTVFLSVILLLLSGCSRTNGPDYSAYAPAEDKRLTIYTSHPGEVYLPLIKEFEERTGIWVEVETGGTLELLERIAAESDKPRCDVIFGGGVDNLEAYRSQFSPYKSSLAKELPADYCQEDSLWTPFSLPPMVLIYNPKLVRTNPPAGWNSLLDPAWKGKIAFSNPELSGSSYTALAALLQILPGSEEELLDAFIRNLEGRILDGSSQVISEVANGSCYIGITQEETALRGIENGSDIALVYPEEGTCAVPDGLAVISGCAHEENAGRFIDFVLERDVQSYLSETCRLRPVRGDAAQPGNQEPDFLLFPYDIAWASSRQEELLTLWHSLCEEVAP